MEKNNWDQLLKVLKENEEKIQNFRKEKPSKHSEDSDLARLKKIEFLEKSDVHFPWKDAHAIEKEQEKILHNMPKEKNYSEKCCSEKTCSEKTCSCEEIQKEQQLYEFKDKYLRLLAETENMRKRLEKDKEETLRYAIEDTIKEFLLPLDNFDSALNFASQADPAVQQWAIGFQMILSQFREVLHKYNITAFHSKGTTYNPHEHEVLEIVETSDFPDKTILEEFSKGYKCGNKILRPARVKISETPSVESKEQLKEQNEADASDIDTSGKN